MSPDRRVFDDTADLAVAAAERIVAVLGRAVADRGRASLVLTGGSTIPSVYRRLAIEPYRDRVTWESVDLFWTDERRVPANHPDSNAGMAFATLVRPVGAPAERVHPMAGDEPAPDRAAAGYEAVIRATLGLGPTERPRFDLVLLGLGADGHVASLFPGHPLLGSTHRLVGSVDATRFPIPEPRVDRLTMTPPALVGARAVAFIVAGEAKAAAVGAALDEPRDPMVRPAQIVDAGRVETTWFLDAGAAARMERP